LDRIVGAVRALKEKREKKGRQEEKNKKTREEKGNASSCGSYRQKKMT
jgi:hypothetical protein